MVMFNNGQNIRWKEKERKIYINQGAEEERSEIRENDEDNRESDGETMGM